jgi:hypothetical protein
MATPFIYLPVETGLSHMGDCLSRFQAPPCIVARQIPQT